MVQERRLPLGVAAIAACLWSGIARSDDDGASRDAVDVNVRAPKRDTTHPPKDPTVAGEVIRPDELEAPGAQAADVLRGHVGLEVTETGATGAPATASIRGATPAQLPVYLAGVRLNDDVAGTADLSRIPLWLIDHIEIYRGNAPVEADRLGIAGALFFEPRWPHGREIDGGAMIGSFGEHSAWAYAALGDRDAGMLAGVSAEGATNDYPFANDHGTLLAPTGTTTSLMSNADETTYDAWLLGRVRVRDAVVDAFANATAREQGVPTLALVPSREARASFDRGIAGVHAVLPAGDETWLEAQTSLSYARAVYSDPLEELALAARQVELDGGRVSQRIAVRTAPTQSTSVHAALDVASETLARDDDGTAAVRARRLESRLAIGIRQWVGGSFSVQPLAALECDGTSITTESACDTLQPTGRLGVAWTRPAWDVFANVGRYARVPALGELYGMSVVVRGNPMLQPESGVATDVGVRWKARELLGAFAWPWAQLGAFVRWSDDLIAFVRSSEGFTVPENVDRAQVSGLEVEVGAGFLHGFALDASATLLDPRNTTPDRLTVNAILPFESRLVVAPRLSFEKRAGLWWLDRIRAEARWIYQSSRYADAAGLAVIPDQSSLDIELLARTRDGRLTARVRVADVLDTQRFDVVGFPLPRRAGYLALESKW